MRLLTIIPLVFFAIGSGLVWLGWDKISPILPSAGEAESAPAYTPDPEKYAVISQEIHYHREKLARKYRAASTAAERDAILQSTKNFLELAMPELMRCWLGTPWDYNGTASTPGNGKVACGYYVSSVMQNAGFNVERIRLAQQPSQNILLTFLPRKQLEIRTGTAYPAYMESIRQHDHGIYIIGLDRHVGFLVHDADGLVFLHSGGVHHQVVCEGEAEALSIRESNYRVIGNLTANRDLLKKWLLNKPFKTHL